MTMIGFVLVAHFLGDFVFQWDAVAKAKSSSNLALTKHLVVYTTVLCIVMWFALPTSTLWRWALLNGVITFLAGVVIYRNFPDSAVWVIGLLVGLELLFHGWTWIMLSLAIRTIPETA